MKTTKKLISVLLTFVLAVSCLALAPGAAFAGEEGGAAAMTSGQDGVTGGDTSGDPGNVTGGDKGGDPVDITGGDPADITGGNPGADPVDITGGDPADITGGDPGTDPGTGAGDGSGAAPGDGSGTTPSGVTDGVSANGDGIDPAEVAGEDATASGSGDVAAMASPSANINLNNPIYKSGEPQWEVDAGAGVIWLLENGASYKISGKTKAYRIVAGNAHGMTFNVTLDGADISTESIGGAPFEIFPGCTVNMVLSTGKANTMTAKDKDNNNNQPGILVPGTPGTPGSPEASMLNISGAGSLTATGGYHAAGIGGAYNSSCGDIIINRGAVTATGGYQAAGIGSGAYGWDGDVEISGGTVKATGGYHAAGIGGGEKGPGGDFEIYGGTVTATGGEGGAGVGGGYGGDGGFIYISGGKVTATGGEGGAGVGGGGGKGSFDYIGIAGGTVKATGGASGAGVGGGMQGDDGSIYIYDGTVTAKGGVSAAGIGSGDNGSSGGIRIYDGKVTATGGASGAGIGGGMNIDGGYIYLGGGTVTATGGASGAGVGSGYNGAGGQITIVGGSVTAKGGLKGAGIGGGERGDGGGNEPAVIAIKITGGTIKATGGSSGAGIGGGYDCYGGYVTINGGSVTATGGAAADGIGGGKTPAGVDQSAELVVINGGTVAAQGANRAIDCDDYTLPPVSYTWWANTAAANPGGAGRSGADAALVNADSIKYIKIAAPVYIDLDTVSYDWQGDGWTLDDYGTLCIKNPQKAYVIAGSTNEDGVWAGTSKMEGIGYCGNFDITLYNASISGAPYGPAFGIEPGSMVRMTLVGDNVLSGGSDDEGNCYAGVWVGNNGEGQESALSIGGSGKLTASGNYDSAAIGGDRYSGLDCGTVEINSGTVIATGGTYGAGIGGGSTGAGGKITINGGAVTANGGAFGAAGIGGGFEGAGGDITINGGMVTAKGSDNGAGIGGGSEGDGGSVKINDGAVEASGGQSSAGIGGGYNGNGGMITINGGAVTATGGSNYASYGGGAGIGGGEGIYTAGTNDGKYGSGGVIVINGGSVKTTGGMYGAGIGGGGYGAGGDITINGGAVDASSAQSSGIGCGWGGYHASLAINGGTVIAKGPNNTNGHAIFVDTNMALPQAYTWKAVNRSGVSSSGFWPGTGGTAYDNTVNNGKGYVNVEIKASPAAITITPSYAILNANDTITLTAATVPGDVDVSGIKWTITPPGADAVGDYLQTIPPANYTGGTLTMTALPNPKDSAELTVTAAVTVNDIEYKATSTVGIMADKIMTSGIPFGTRIKGLESKLTVNSAKEGGELLPIAYILPPKDGAGIFSAFADNPAGSIVIDKVELWTTTTKTVNGKNVTTEQNLETLGWYKATPYENDARYIRIEALDKAPASVTNVTVKVYPRGETTPITLVALNGTSTFKLQLVRTEKWPALTFNPQTPQLNIALPLAAAPLSVTSADGSKVTINNIVAVSSANANKIVYRPGYLTFGAAPPKAATTISYKVNVSIDGYKAMPQSKWPTIKPKVVNAVPKVKLEKTKLTLVRPDALAVWNSGYYHVDPVQINLLTGDSKVAFESGYKVKEVNLSKYVVGAKNDLGSGFAETSSEDIYANGVLTLKPGPAMKSGKATFTVSYEGTTRTQTLTMNVTVVSAATGVTITAKPNTFTVNTGHSTAAGQNTIGEVNITPNAANLFMGGWTINTVKQKTSTGSKALSAEDLQKFKDAIGVSSDYNKLTLTALNTGSIAGLRLGAVPKDTAYEVYVMPNDLKGTNGAPKTVKVTLNITDKAPALSVAQKGKIDVVNPLSYTTATLTLANTSSGIANVTLVDPVDNALASTEFKAEFTGGNTIKILPVAGSVLAPNIAHPVTVKVDLMNGQPPVYKKINITPTQTVGKKWQSVSAVTLYKDVPEAGADIGLNLLTPANVKLGDVCFNAASLKLAGLNSDSLKLVRSGSNNWTLFLGDGVTLKSKTYTVKLDLWAEGAYLKDGDGNFLGPIKDNKNITRTKATTVTVKVTVK